jgi:predicted nucleic acid-binding protein
MNKLLKDAIADAKAVRETALANAKAALEEAFAPKLQSMLSHKIKEEMEDEEEVEAPADQETTEIARMRKMAGIVSEEGEEMEDEMPAEEPAEEMPTEEEEMPAEDEMPTEEEEMPADDSEEISDEDLEEILRELEGEEEGSDEEESLEEGEDEEYEEAPKTEAKKKKKMMEEEGDEEEAEPKTEGAEGEDDEEVDLEEIIRALREEDEEAGEEEAEKVEEIKTELNEAYGVIKFLRSKLNEVNLLNAKLLFVNKLFRKGELTESQKVKIIETFDRAKNVREAKLIYATLAESVGKAKATSAAPKKRMTEGLASAPQKKTNIITESNDVVNRFKSLVNYNK